jgi:LPS-assembly protein
VATFRRRRTDLTASYSWQNMSLSARYAYIAAQPDYGFGRDRQELTLGGSARISEDWRVFASGTYDFEQSLLVHRAIGIAFSYCECFDLRLTMTERQNHPSSSAVRNFGVQINLRTLGTFGTDTATVMR